jgi:HlyD family secretion protein
VKKLLVLLLVIGVSLTAGAYYISHPRTPTVNEDLFTYASVERGNLMESISATGILQPTEVLVVGSEMPGTVVELLAHVNDSVAEDSVLLKLDERRIRRKLEEAENGVATAKAYLTQAEALRDAAQLYWQYNRDLQKKQVGSRAELEQAEAKLKAAEAGVKTARYKIREAELLRDEARLTLELMQVRVPRTQNPPDSAHASPKHYLVMERKVQLGQVIGPQVPVPLFTLASDLHQMEVHAQVAEGDIGKVRKRLEAVFTVSAYSETDIQFRGKVKQIRPTPTTVQGAVYFSTVIDVTNHKDPDTGEWRLRPGMTAAVDIIRREHKDVWKMPTAALNFQLEEAYQSEAARARLAEWRQKKENDDWKTVWIWDAQRNSPWPIFVRIGGLKGGETGIKDGQFNEVLEWEEGREPRAGAPNLRVIISAPPSRRPGLFDQPNIKIS